jgi:hypothetical protein
MIDDVQDPTVGSNSFFSKHNHDGGIRRRFWLILASSYSHYRTGGLVATRKEEWPGSIQDD